MNSFHTFFNSYNIDTHYKAMNSYFKNVFTFSINLFFFFLDEKETKNQEKVIGHPHMLASSRYLFWPTRLSESCSVRCDVAPHVQERTIFFQTNLLSERKIHLADDLLAVKNILHL